jgi:hypothetical protein
VRSLVFARHCEGLDARAADRRYPHRRFDNWPSSWNRFRAYEAGGALCASEHGQAVATGDHALSQLLVESFERYLFPSRPPLGSTKAPALILNATIVSHPAEESDVLTRTMDKATQCDEAERTFNLDGGGRLIFTNLRDTDAFPQRGSPIPDVRLPYEIVRDADVCVASASALNANFPPVFPNARVRVRSDDQDCKFRSYYVTDGGAVENLGLTSALYAIKSALAKISPGTAVRPIHVVIAEASAVSYDYSQDCGVSALLGSKERLTGDLTNELIDNINQKLKEVSGANADMRFHYLALPLAFRARGGFEYHLNDPRPRVTSWLNFLPFAGLRAGKTTVDHNDLSALWLGTARSRQFLLHRQFVPT